MEYAIHRKLNRTGKRIVFYPTINNKRLNSTNYVRKYDARGLVKTAIAKYGVEKLEKMFEA